MLSQRFFLRASQQATSGVRSAVTKRLNSTKAQLPDNAFNREREAVKAHAAATSG